MSFHDVKFPVRISKESSGGPDMRVEVTELDSGYEHRVSYWDGARRSFNASLGVRSPEDVIEIQSFWLAREGMTHSFRWQDEADFHTNPTNSTWNAAPGTRDQSCFPAQGDGTTTAFQLAKKYISGAITVTRHIKLPQNGTIQIWVNSVLQTEGVNYTINYATGVVTFSVAPTAGHNVEWSGKFDIPVRFAGSGIGGIKLTAQGFDAAAIPDIPIVEVFDETDLGYSHNYFYQGARELSMTSNITLAMTDGFLQILEPQSSGLIVTLPNPASLPDGGVHFTIINTHASNTLVIKNHSGTTLATLAGNTGVRALITKVNAAGTSKSWYLIGD